MLSIPDREGKEASLKDYLQQEFGEIFTVHRLDRETSGLIIFAKTAEAHKHFSRQFEERRTVKMYLGLVMGSPPATEGTITAPIAENMAKRGSMLVHRRGKNAFTAYKLLQDFKQFSLVQFQLHTGRTHQIRVHARELGNPLAVDSLYGDGKPVYLSSFKNRFKLGKNTEEERPLLNRLALHAWQLTIEDENGSTIELEAPLSKDIKVTVVQLEKTGKRK